MFPHKEGYAKATVLLVFDLTIVVKQGQSSLAIGTPFVAIFVREQLGCPFLRYRLFV